MIDKSVIFQPLAFNTAWIGARAGGGHSRAHAAVLLMTGGPGMEIPTGRGSIGSPGLSIKFQD